MFNDLNINLPAQEINRGKIGMRKEKILKSIFQIALLSTATFMADNSIRFLLLTNI